MSRMILDFDDDELSDCSIGDDDDMWDSDTESTSTDSFYKANDLLGQELFTIWELESYNSDNDSEMMYGDDDIASITSDYQEEEKDDKEVVVSNLPADLNVKKTSHHSKSGEQPSQHTEADSDISSIDSLVGVEERWHVDKNGKAKKSPFADASWERDMKRREIQRKMRNLEERISVIRGIIAPESKDERPSRPGRRKSPGRRRKSPGRGRRTARSPGRGRQSSRGRKHRSLSPDDIARRSMSPPRYLTFNDTLENRRKQVAMARQELQDILARGRSNKEKGGAPPITENGKKNGRKNMTNPRHLHRQAMKRMNPNSIPSRLRTI